MPRPQSGSAGRAPSAAKRVQPRFEGLSSDERRRLISRARALGTDLDGPQVEAIDTFLGVLSAWTSRSNLVSITSREDLLERHVVDSLASASLLATLGSSIEVADLGSGAGFPGIPLAVVLRPKRMLLLEARRRRANFLRAVARVLPDLPLEVVRRRVEELPGGDPWHVDAIVSRAAIPLWDLLAIGTQLLRRGGLLVAYRGPKGTSRELAESGVREIDRALRPEATIEYELHGGRLPFRLEVWRRTGESAQGAPERAGFPPRP